MQFLGQISEACFLQQVRRVAMIRPPGGSSSSPVQRMSFTAFSPQKLRPELIGASQTEQSCFLLHRISPPMSGPAQRARMARNREEALRRLQSRRSLVYGTEKREMSEAFLVGQHSILPSASATNIMQSQSDGSIQSTDARDTMTMQAGYNYSDSTGNLMNQVLIGNQVAVTTLRKQSSNMASTISVEKHASESGSALRKQEFDYVVVIDFEATCDKDMHGLKPQEIIEFPAVIVDCRQLIVGDCFQTYVKPVHHPILTEFCTQLTGIRQEQVDKGIPLVEALYWHDQWLETKGIKGKNFAILIWSDWDCKTMLDSECKLKGLNKPQYFNRWINLKALFQNAYNGRRCNLRKAVETAGLRWTGRAHCGLDDALNTARLALELMRRGMVLTITGTLESEPLVAQIRRPAWPGPVMQVTAISHYAKPEAVGNDIQTDESSVRIMSGVNSNEADKENFSNNWSTAAGNNLVLQCYCGVYCKRRMVKKPGPTCGRLFFACGNWSTSDGSKCNFFQWAVP